MRKQIATALVALSVLLPSAALAKGETYRYTSGRVDLAGQVFYNQCNGETVTATSGYFEYNFQYTVNKNKYSGTDSYQSKGAGVGDFSNKRYSINGQAADTFSGSLKNFAYQATGSSQLKLDQKGPKGNDMFFVFDYQLKISPSGNIDQYVYNFRLVCS